MTKALSAGHRELPQNWQPLFAAKRQEFLDDVKRKDLGQSPMLQRLISLPSAALAHYLALRAESYDIVIDPRGVVEDKNITDAIGDLTKEVARLVRENSTNLKSVETNIRSENCAGLQVADVLAGEVRRWFVSHPEFLEFSSGRELLSATELKGLHFGKAIGRTTVKPERRKKMPGGLAARLHKADQESVFPYFRQLLANGLISCIAKYGEFRHIDFASRQVIDSPDDAIGEL
ncbi:MAG TPA: hypothetical protein VKY85_20440 [Candidatus Angelobacter sp.]|nr:hypothetical protein [Candidatus Angelobacter sp.]